MQTAPNSPKDYQQPHYNKPLKLKKADTAEKKDREEVFTFKSNIVEDIKEEMKKEMNYMKSIGRSANSIKN